MVNSFRFDLLSCYYFLVVVYDFRLVVVVVVVNAVVDDCCSLDFFSIQILIDLDSLEMYAVERR